MAFYALLYAPLAVSPGIDDVSIDDMTTPDEISPEELEQHLKEAKNGGPASVQTNINMYLALESKTYNDQKIPGEIIMKNGKELPQYAASRGSTNATAAEVKRLLIPVTENTAKVFIRSRDKKMLQNLGAFRASCIEKKICRAYAAGMGPPKKVPNLPDTWQIGLHISYMCRKAGTSRVSFDVEKRVALGLGKTTFAFSWEKKCANGPAYGFNVYLRDGIGESKGEVVRDGSVSPEFNKFSKNGFTVGFSESSTWFLIKGPEETTDENFALNFNVSNVRIKPFKPSRNSSPKKGNDDTLAVMLGGEASIGGTLSPGDSVPLILRYDCLDSGTSLISVIFKIQGSKKSTPTIVSFDFKKVCHVGPLPGFDIAVSGIDLGSDFFAVKDGKPVQAFTPADHTARITPKETALNLEIMMTKPLVQVAFERPIVTVTQRKIGFVPHKSTQRSSDSNPFARAMDKIIGPHSIFGGRGSIFDRLASPFRRIGVHEPTRSKTSGAAPGIGDFFNDILGGSHRNDRLQNAIEDDFFHHHFLNHNDDFPDDDGIPVDPTDNGFFGGGGVRRLLSTERKLWRPKRHDDVTKNLMKRTGF